MIKTEIKELQVNIFPGFYESMLSEGHFDEHCEIEYFKEIKIIPESIDNHDVVFNYYYKDYERDVCNAYIEHLSEYLIEHDLAQNVEFSKLCSPDFYNYSTDSLYISCDLNIKKLEKIINENLKKFQCFLYENYQSYEGYTSLIETNINEFLAKFKQLEENYLSIALMFCMLFLHEGRESLAFELNLKCIDDIHLSEYIESIEIRQDNKWITIDF